MKKVLIATMAIVFSMFLFSCSDDSVTETDALYDMQATEGGDDEKEPPPGDEDGN